MHTCTLRTRPVSRPSNPHYKGSCVTRSNPALVAQSLTSRRLRLIPRCRVPITVPTLLVSVYRPLARLRSNTKISLSMLIDVTADADQGQAHLSPRWSQPALSFCLKVTVGGRRELRPTTTWMEPPAPSAPTSESLAGTLRADPTLITINSMYVCIVYARYHLPSDHGPIV